MSREWRVGPFGNAHASPQNWGKGVGELLFVCVCARARVCVCVSVLASGSLPSDWFELRFERMVGRRASASLHRYQKLSCVLTPIGDQHYPAAARSASRSSQIVGLPA